MARKRKKKVRVVPHTTRVPRKVRVGLRKVDSLMADGHLDRALEIAESLDQQYPGRVDILNTLAALYSEANDPLELLAIYERLAELSPNDPDIWLTLGAAYMRNTIPMSALNTFHHFLERWPDDDRAGEVRQLVAELEERKEGLLEDAGFTGENRTESVMLHEKMQSLMARREYRKVRETAEQLLQQQPQYAPALNNMSLAYLAEGQLDKAIETAEQVLEFAPTNHHALSNLIRFLVMDGRIDDAQELGERLHEVESRAPDVEIKKAEAFSFLGHDERVLAAFAQAKERGHLEPPLADPYLYHLAAVATLRLEREKEARTYWKKALEIAPRFTPARDNLDDLRKRVGTRHAPWPFDFTNWISKQTFDNFRPYLEKMSESDDETAVTSGVRQYLKQYPRVAALVPLLFDRGDPQGREFALRMAMAAETSDMHEALRDFALSKRGPDEMRLEAARTAVEAGLLPAGKIRLWVEGEWRELIMLGFEITDEPRGEYDAEVTDLMVEAVEALHEHDGQRAEAFLQQALEKKPGDPSLSNNLALAYELQGRSEEAYALVRQIHEEHPDYFFARTGLARHYLREGNVKEAREIVEPLLLRKDIHISEFVALCQIQIEICLADNQIEGARSWLGMWESVDADHPQLESWQRRIERQSRRWR